MCIKKIAEVLSFSVLLGASLVFGCLGMNSEMGLSILAGAVSLVFLNLEKIASFKGGGFEIITKEQKEQIQAVIEKETEPVELKFEAYGTDEQARSVIAALKNQKYTWRYVKGLTEESRQPKDQVLKTLEWLELNSLAKKSKSLKGDVWSLTQRGREVFAKL